MGDVPLLPLVTIACACEFCKYGVECHGVECVEKPGGCIVHELNVSQVVCVGVE
jgi:hypothetical protein